MEAKRSMLAGIDLLAGGDFHGALGHFDRVLAIRGVMAWRDDPQLAWEMAAAHLNRGDALREIGDLKEAFRAVDLAIKAMAHVPLNEYPQCSGRLVLAWINRAGLSGEIVGIHEALEGFSKAEELLRTGDKMPNRKVMISMLHANRARMWLRHNRAIRGWEDSRSAVAALPDVSTEERVVDAAIRARAILCHALAMLLDESGGARLPADWIAEATDAAEEALALVRASARREPWMGDLVRYGAKIYRACQPWFLGEFVTEWVAAGGPLAGDENLAKEMRAELLLAQAEVELRVMRHAHDTELVQRETALLASLQAAGEKLVTFPPCGSA